VKAHLRSSDEPLTANQPLTASCGAEIKKAYFAMSVDTSGVTGRTISALISANSLLLCRKCQVAPLPGNYVYLVTEATDKLEAADAAAD
jgi:hypothetical protein